MGRALEAGVVADEKLAPPHVAVGSIPRAVEDDPHHRLVQAVLAHARRHVRVVVLDRHRRQPLLGERVPRAQVAGVQVVRDHLRRHLQKLRHVLDRVLEGAPRRLVLEVPDVVAEEQLASTRQAHRVLQLRPHRQQRRQLERRLHRLGGVAARSADRCRLAARLLPDVTTRDDRIVHARVDLALAHQERVSDPRKALERVLVAERDRLVGDIAARRHQRVEAALEEQVVHGRVRKHRPVAAVARRDPRGDRRFPRRACARARSAAAGCSAARASRSPTCAYPRTASSVGDITAKGFSSRRLRRRSLATASSLRGVDHQVVATQALDRDDRPFAQQLDGRFDRVR